MHARPLLFAILGVCLSCGKTSHDPSGTSGAGAAGTGGSTSVAGGGNSGSNGGNANQVGEAGEAGNGAVPIDSVTVEPSWRLTNTEYTNSVHDLLGVTVTAPLDPDGSIAGYRVGLGAGDATVQLYHAAAIQVAEDALLHDTTLVSCTTSEIAADNVGCADKFISALAPKVFRRPLDAATKAGLTQLYATIAPKFGFNRGVQAVLEELLQSPYFLYHLELEERALGLGTVDVTGYSMASRLSYLIWSSVPDDELYAKAAAGELSTPAQIREQALRLLSDPKAKLGLQNFYEQWLDVTDLPDSKGAPYTSFGPAQKASVLASFRAQADAALWADSNGLSTLLAGDTAFYDANTAALLGLQTAPGGPLQAGKVNAAERLGILTHPAIMGTFATNTGSHPIHRGTFIWDQILCQPLPDPPANVPPFPGVPANTSTRHAYENFDSPASCQACHARIDPVGFLFENFDTLGTYRTVDDAAQPIDSSANVVGASDSTLNGPTANAVEFVKRLSNSDEVSQCFATQLFRYAEKRLESDADQAFLADLVTRYAQSGQSTKELLSALTQSRGFLQRINEE